MPRRRELTEEERARHDRIWHHRMKADFVLERLKTLGWPQELYDEHQRRVNRVRMLLERWRPSERREQREDARWHTFDGFAAEDADWDAAEPAGRAVFEVLLDIWQAKIDDAITSATVDEVFGHRRLSLPKRTVDGMGVIDASSNNSVSGPGPVFIWARDLHNFRLSFERLDHYARLNGVYIPADSAPWVLCCHDTPYVFRVLSVMHAKGLSPDAVRRVEVELRGRRQAGTWAEFVAAAGEATRPRTEVDRNPRIAAHHEAHVALYGPDWRLSQEGFGIWTKRPWAPRAGRITPRSFGAGA